MQTQTTEKVEVFTVRDVMAETGIKARATLDKYIELGVISPIKKRGKQPKINRGRKFYFKMEQIEKLKKYMLTHGRIQPKGLEPVERPKEHRQPRKTKEVTKETLEVALESAIQKVEYLQEVVKSLSETITKMNTNH